jgi:NAD(P)-dependent dehydrogenase (short-subunit alcohol dehydrogenase family)
MAMELADSNIRLNPVSPTLIKTPIYQTFIKSEVFDETLNPFNQFHPIGRIAAPEKVLIQLNFYFTTTQVGLRARFGILTLE